MISSVSLAKLRIHMCKCETFHVSILYIKGAVLKRRHETGGREGVVQIENERGGGKGFRTKYTFDHKEEWVKNPQKLMTSFMNDPKRNVKNNSFY